MNDNNNNDKPFVCTEDGCPEKFSNVDHLNVHQKKHSMRLKFPEMGSSCLSIVDQTPTPSRILGHFLKNWEEIGLHNEIQEITNLTPILNDTNHSKTADDILSTHTSNSKSSSADNNPFAQSFKNALTTKRPSNRLLATTSDSPLNTPSIFPNEGNTGLMAIVNAALNTADLDFQLDQTPSIIPTVVSISNSVSNGSVSDLVDGSNTSVSIKSETTKQTNNNQKQNNNKNNNAIPSKAPSFQAVPVIRSASANNLQTVPNIVISEANNNIIKTINTAKLKTVSTAQTNKSTAIIAPKTKESSITFANNNTSLYKVILKLPDGRSVQLPIMNGQLPQQITQPTITTISTPAKTNDLNVITTNQMIQLSDKLTVESLNSSQSNQNSSTGSLPRVFQSKVDATLASLPPKAKPGRKSKFAPEEDPREKKARSLERNRAAAMRCRLKRKHWIDSLEEKADEYEKINEKLQSEVGALRREVTLLKTALMAHKDCPVTLQQQKVTNDIVTIVTTNGSAHRLENGIESNGLT